MRTVRLILRNFNKRDLNDFHEYAKNENVGPNAGWPAHKNIKESKKILKGFIRETEVFAIQHIEDEKVIGSISFYDDVPIKDFPKLKQREMGYSLSYDYWGKGIMSEVCKEMIRYAFEVLDLDIIWCGHFTFNERSRKVIEKSGFKFYKTIMYDARQLNKKIEANIYMFTKADYKKVK